MKKILYITLSVMALLLLVLLPLYMHYGLGVEWSEIIEIRPLGPILPRNIKPILL